ncbi:lysine 2,3-aminomutase YodO family protein [Candidatus Magnetoovum chiemensis]|nr:lysine 2,3-aminomutase YodO family protein [Candidatus Magnetoovum chiemensis]
MKGESNCIVKGEKMLKETVLDVLDKPPAQSAQEEMSNTVLSKVRDNECKDLEFSSEKWEDGNWQFANRIKTIAELASLLNLDASDLGKYNELIKTFHYSITPYYLSLIDWSDTNDPIRKQCVPDLKEIDFNFVGCTDPLDEEDDMQVPGLVHRYPDRVLAIITNICAMYCRHCTRKRKWTDSQRHKTKAELQNMIEYIKRASNVREVIVSGGDPLTVNLSLLDWFLGELRKISNVEVIRIGTRLPVVLPMGVTDAMVRMLERHRPLWVNTQFNHPREITADAAAACDRFLKAGIPVSNQSVLLKGINDSVDTMKALCYGLQRIMVRPYYLFHCDPVIGAEHFRTSIWKGIEIMEELRGHIGGLCVPTYVVDAPEGGGKIPLQPFYLLSMTEKEVLLRNYEGKLIKYFNPS